MSCHTVFDAARQPLEWTWIAQGAAFVALSLSLLVLRKCRPMWLLARGSRWASGVGLWLMLGFSVIWTVWVSVTILGSLVRTKNAVRSAAAQTVEGRVTNFHPMPYEGHDMERFSVEGVHFAYSDYVLTGGFNKTSSHGGPLHDGAYVRIGYVGKSARATIVHLEVCSQS